MGFAAPQQKYRGRPSLRCLKLAEFETTRLLRDNEVCVPVVNQDRTDIRNGPDPASLLEGAGKKRCDG